MKYLKFFEEMKIDKNQFPFEGHDLSPREKKILTDLTSEEHLNEFTIKVEDHYYYINRLFYYYIFDGFNELKDYVLSCYYIDTNKPKEFLELLKNSKFDPSFHDNKAIRWASMKVYNHPHWDTSVLKKIIEILLNDERVITKLTKTQIYNYTNEISKIF